MSHLSLVAHAGFEAPDDLEGTRRALAALLDGADVSARVGEAELGPLLTSLCYALADLASGARSRAVVRLCVTPDPWEIGLERTGRDVLVSVFLPGPVPTVALWERRMSGDALAASVLSAIDALVARPRTAPTDAEGLATARRDLLATLPFSPARDDVEPMSFVVEPAGGIPIVLSAEVTLRPSSGSASTTGALRADLFSVLFRGRLRIALGEHVREIGDVHVFVVAEQLVALARDALEAATRGQALFRRLTVGGAICAVRVKPGGGCLLTLGTAARPGRLAETWTFPATDTGTLAQGVVAFARALVRSLVRRDRSQAHNLRVVALRTRVRELGERVRDTMRIDARINVAPESYRAFAMALRANRRPEDADVGPVRLRYSTRWVGGVPGIDLRSTFLCGDALLVGAARELYALERQTGMVIWRRAVARGISIVSPSGLARLEPDGRLTLHDLQDGDVIWTARLQPRVGATASGAVVNAPGLPRLLVVSEGSRHLVAVDLASGDVTWRHAARRGGSFHVRRAGKLCIVASGETTLTALDVVTGEVVWRACDALRFASHAAFGGDSLLAVAGGGAVLGRGGARLHHLDAWSGATRWVASLPSHSSPVGAPLLARETAIVVAHGPRGTTLAGFDLETGTMRFDRVACSGAASCLVVDDQVIVNSEAGELCSIDARSGTTRYRHVLPGGPEGDRPRRLEPILRNGALFVPQDNVHVIRPRDGTIIGRIDAGLVPDLLRVDERCDVYVAEESGHIAAFGAGPRLALVK